MNTQTIKRLGLIFAVVCLAVALVMIKRDADPRAEAPAEAATVNAGPGDIAKLPRLVELGATTCIPCQQMQPILDSLRRDFGDQLDVVFIHVYEEKDKAAPFNIRLMPTQVFLDAEGKELFRHEGFFPRDQILAKWRSLGYDFAMSDAASETQATETSAGDSWPAAAPNLAEPDGLHLDVLYLHPTLRCEACLAAEKHAEEALREFLPDEFNSGFVRWAAINYEEGSGLKLAERFGIESGSVLILAETIDGKPGRSRRLDRILEVGPDRDTTAGYVVSELHTFMQQCEMLPAASEQGP